MRASILALGILLVVAGTCIALPVAIVLKSGVVRFGSSLGEASVRLVEGEVRVSGETLGGVGLNAPGGHYAVRVRRRDGATVETARFECPYADAVSSSAIVAGPTGAIVVAIGDHVLVSADSGATWSAWRTPSFDGIPAVVRDVSVLEDGECRVRVGARFGADRNAEFRSRDNGKTWQAEGDEAGPAPPRGLPQR